MKSPKLKIALIGAGAMGQLHARLLANADNFQLVALVDRDPQKLKKLQKKYPVSCFKSVNVFLKSGQKVEAAVVATPAEAHYRTSLPLLKNKIPLLVEKPLAESVKTAQKIIREAEHYRTEVMVGYTERFNPVIEQIHHLLNHSFIGKINALSTERIGLRLRPRQKTGVTIDIAVHDLDILLYLLGQEPEALIGVEQKKVISSLADLAIATLVFPKNIIANIRVDHISAVKKRTISIIGEKGTLFGNLLTQELFYYELIDPVSIDEYAVLRGELIGRTTQIPLRKQEPLAKEQEIFSQVVRNKQKNPIPPKTALISLRLAEAITRSSQGGKLIKNKAR